MTMSVTEIQYPSPLIQGPQPVFANHIPIVPVTNAEPSPRKMGQKFKVAVYGAILFMVVGYIGTYRVTNMLFTAFTQRAYDIVGEDGFPTGKGIVVHAFVFLMGMLVLLTHV